MGKHWSLRAAFVDAVRNSALYRSYCANVFGVAFLFA